MAVEALFFDVFGTLADWRSGIAREAKAILAPLGHDKIDWLAFADAWRGEYQPGMEEVRSGKIPFSKLDILHRRNLERILPRFNLTGLGEDTLRNLNLAWHRLDTWPDVALGLAPGECMMVAAHSNDLKAAAAQGLATAHIARPGEHGPNTGETAPKQPTTHAATSLEELATQLGV
jgi:2-haloacid dehalogenase